MTEKITQCCYTNATREVGGKVSSGWQPVAVSDDIPPDAYNNCIKLQNSNSSIQSHPLDEDGNILNLYEVSGDGAYIYVSRTRFGLLDRLGRPNMFSHAYIFPVKTASAAGDPNIFLTLDRSNFAENEEDALMHREKLLRHEPFTIQGALETAGMSLRAYLTMIRCVYARFSERKAAKPVYIGYDGDEKKMQAILFCIYYGLPFYVRRNLSAASAESATSAGKNLVFSKYASRHEAYFEPVTGENNVLTSRMESRLERYGFADYAVRNLDSIDPREYFEDLEALAVELGDMTASNELILKIAHQMLLGQEPHGLSDEELDGRLSDALRSKTQGNVRMEEYISELLDEIRARKQQLTEESEANLSERLALPATERLASAGEQYWIYRLSSMSAEEAAKTLSYTPEAAFSRYQKELARSKNGLEILDAYYSEYPLRDKELSWDALLRLLRDTEFMPSRMRTINCVALEAWNLYCRQLKSGAPAKATMNDFLRVMGMISSREGLAECEQKAREKYWELMPYEMMSYSGFQEYTDMIIINDKCRCVVCFYSIFYKYGHSDIWKLLAELNRFFVEQSSFIAKEGLARLLVTKAEAEISPDPVRWPLLSEWLEAAAAVGGEQRFTDALEALSSLRERRFTRFASIYKDMARTAGYDAGLKAEMKFLGRLYNAELRQLDTAAAPVPLDIWLLPAASVYDNCFKFVEDGIPEVLMDEDLSEAISCPLMRVPAYLEQAEEYAAGNGAESKLVRKFLNEFKIVDKRRRAQEQLKRVTAGQQSNAGNPGRQEDFGRSRASNNRTLPQRTGGETSKKGLFKDIFGRKQ